MTRVDPSHAPGKVTFPGAEARTLETATPTEIPVRNTGERMIQVGVNYHFFEVNPTLGFDRIAAYGKRIAGFPGVRVDFPPGEIVRVPLVPIGGDRAVRSFYGVLDGDLGEQQPEDAMDRLRAAVHEQIADPPSDEGTHADG